MIIEFLIGVAANVVDWLAGTINGWAPDAWFTDLGERINDVTSSLDGLGVWVDWLVIGGCVVAVLGAWTLFGNVKLTRVAASHVPLVGGGGN